MDRLDDDEIIEIWERTKKHVDVEKLKTNISEKPQNAQKKLEEILDRSDGRAQTMIEHGFAKKASKIGIIAKEIGALPPRVEIYKETKFKIRRAKGRALIRVQKNVHISYSQWHQKDAYYIRQKNGRILTWGTIK